MKSEVAKLKERREERARKEALEDGIIAILPDDLPAAPSVCNEQLTERALEPVAWLSFSAPSYDPQGTWNPVAILQALERAGWKQSPASLCKWDDYRRSAYPGLSEDIPDEKPGSFGRMDKLTDVAPIAPLWITPCPHTNADCKLFMTAPDGRLFKVLIDLPGIVGIGARRHEYRGGWSYERGSATLRFPPAWHSHPHCTVNENSRAYVDTEQGLSGAIYFTPHDEQSAWPMTASEFLAGLLSKPESEASK